MLAGGLVKKQARARAFPSRHCAGDVVPWGTSEPRWNHGLRHAGHVEHASPGDHHGIVAKARCSTASGLCFVLSASLLAIQKNRGASEVPFQPVRPYFSRGFL